MITTDIERLSNALLNASMAAVNTEVEDSWTRLSSVAMDAMMADDDERCYIPGDRGRRVDCNCLRRLLVEHNQQTKEAIGNFIVKMKELEASKQTTKTYVKKRRILESVAKALNNPSRQEYQFPVSLPDGDSSSVILCRGAIVEIVKRTFLWTWKQIEEYFPASTEMKGRERKNKLFALLSYFLKVRLADEADVDWNVPDLKHVNANKNTMKSWVRSGNYALRQIVSTNCVRRVDAQANWLTSEFRGRICAIPDGTGKEVFPLLAQKGKTGVYQDVHRNSVSSGYPANHKVQYKILDRGDQNMKQEIKKIDTYLQPIIAQALGGGNQCEVESAYLISPHFAPQVPHYDFTEEQMRGLTGEVFLGLCPVTESGCYLQVWKPIDNQHATRHGEVLFIPYGCILILPGSTIHGGGFLSNGDTRDLRLHFYIYVGGADKKRQSNTYLEEEKYMMQASLDPGKALHKLFTSDIISCLPSKRKKL